MFYYFSTLLQVMDCIWLMFLQALRNPSVLHWIHHLSWQKNWWMGCASWLIPVLAIQAIHIKGKALWLWRNFWQSMHSNLCIHMKIIWKFVFIFCLINIRNWGGRDAVSRHAKMHISYATIIFKARYTATWQMVIPSLELPVFLPDSWVVMINLAQLCCLEGSSVAEEHVCCMSVYTCLKSLLHNTSPGTAASICGMDGWLSFLNLNKSSLTKISESLLLEHPLICVCKPLPSKKPKKRCKAKRDDHKEEEVEHCGELKCCWSWRARIDPAVATKPNTCSLFCQLWLFDLYPDGDQNTSTMMSSVTVAGRSA